MAATSKAIQELEAFKEVLKNDLGKAERVMGEVEVQYLQADYSQAGHVLKGFEGLLSSKENMRKRARNKPDEKADERLFSLSSKTSPASLEVEGAYDASAALAQKVAGGFAQNSSKRYGEKGR